MIFSTDIDIELTKTTAIKSELSRIFVDSLFLHNNETHVHICGDKILKQIPPDGSLNALGPEERQQHGRETVVNVSKCGELVVKFIDAKSHEAHIYNLNQGRTYSFPCNAFMSRFPPKAASVGHQLVIAGDTKGGTLIRVVPIDSPCLWKEGQREEKEVKDICGYDKYSVLALFNDAIHQIDIQTGTCKLLAHASPFTNSLKCNSKYIFAGMTRQKISEDGRYDTSPNYDWGYQKETDRIQVLDRVSGKRLNMTGRFLRRLIATQACVYAVRAFLLLLARSAIFLQYQNFVSRPIRSSFCRQQQIVSNQPTFELLTQ